MSLFAFVTNDDGNVFGPLPKFQDPPLVVRRSKDLASRGLPVAGTRAVAVLWGGGFIL